ncbi:MAG: LPXTG cell wall anchor domain-containing protein [Candidatus Lactobacillus pullistercoris]|uniref:LPXTG cell wall anchor domain-containing protein n=1 Tax=Candidatus Lactobacillus pullistercoris TaxID=2838636 RepID=A0A9E2KRI3_9LACO|nr:LPXTG cell wall anchor domain-containing protein [Candidatus Lactobacillus pullistercoris]
MSAKTENNDVETLPKTGEGQNQAGIIGLLLANLASLFGLAAGKKKN